MGGWCDPMDPRLSECWKAQRALPCDCVLCGGGDVPLLDLPDTRQCHDHDCGEAAVRCLLAYLRVVAPAPSASPIDGLDPRLIENHLRDKVGLRVVSGNMGVEDLRHHASEGRPVLVLVHWPKDSASHWCVARGVSRGRVYYHDPDTGRASLPIPEFLSAWKAEDARMSRPFRQWAITCWVP